MIYKVRDFRSYVPRDLGKDVRAELLECCVSVAQVGEKSIDQDKREVVAVVTDPSIDSYGEIVAVGAFKDSLKNYMMNPVIMPAHQHRLANGHPACVGQAVSIGEVDGALVARIRFGTHEIGEQYWICYREQSLRAFSVGFRSKKAGKDENNIYTYYEATLKEISAVAVPANENAIVLSFIKGQLATFAGATDDAMRTEDLHSAIEEMQRQIDGLLGVAEPGDENTRSAVDRCCETVKAATAAVQS